MSEDAAEGTLRERVIDQIKTCYDPEIPVDIWELGLIYDVAVQQGGEIHVRMTLTSPMCPVAEILPPEVEAKIRQVDGVANAQKPGSTSTARAAGSSSPGIGAHCPVRAPLSPSPNADRCSAACLSEVAPAENLAALAGYLPVKRS
jgi:metal-sulfur cluster biosynthetic enzyme